MFIISHSQKMVFPISFILPESPNARKGTEESYSYSFALSSQYNPKDIYNPLRVFLGVHLIKYTRINKQGYGEPAILPIFIFKNKEYEQDTLNPSFIYSMYTGKLLKYFASDFYYSRVEEGEIISRMNITHQELYYLYRYYGLYIYIMDDTPNQLFLTRRKDSDEALKHLITKLKMRKVDLEVLSRKPTELFRSFKVVDSRKVSPLRILKRIEIDDLFSSSSHNSSGKYVPPHLRGGRKTFKLKAKKNKKINSTKKIKTKIIKSKI